MTISKLVLIGASTGGPGRIYTLLSSLEPEFDGTIIIAQHMAAPFITSFAAQLQTICPLNVIEITSPERLQNKNVYICHTTSHLFARYGDVWIEPSEGIEYPFNPEINALFLSAATLDTSIRKMGIILTGIGEDGARGLQALYQAGGICYFENETSSAVYGMPRRAKELVPMGRSGSIESISAAVNAFGGENHVRMA